MAIILRPLINEKSTNLMKLSSYTFEVDKNTTKKQIQKLVKEKFKVDVLAVRMVNLKGKVKMQRTKRVFYTLSGTKKAIVKIKNGQKIALFEQVMAEEQSEDETKVTTAKDQSSMEVKEKKGLFGGPKVKVERESNLDEEKITKQTDTKNPTKVSQKEAKKGK